MGLLADAFSYGDSLKRKVGGLLADPMGTLELGINRIKEDNNNALNLFANAHPMAGDKTVLNTPAQKAAMQKQLADYASTVGMAGIFVGPKSQTWDKAAAAKAQELAQKGTDPRKIWSETGTWKGPDGMWRQEIDDSGSLGAVFKRGPADGLAMRQDANPLEVGQVRDVLRHPRLDAAYPNDVMHIRADMTKNNGGAYGAATEWGDPEGIALSVNGGTSTALHELQHAIQQREGFAKGGSQGQMRDVFSEIADQKAKEIRKFSDLAYSGDPLNMSDVRKPGALKKALEASKAMQDAKGMITRLEQFPELGFDAYKKLAGEAEARATQARIPLDAAQRRALFPADSYDVPLDSLILRGMGGY